MPLRVALRNTVAVIAPLALGLAIDQVPAGLAMTTGAINTMFTDQPGPYRQRMQRMLLAALAAGLSALLGILIGENTMLFVIAAVMFGLLGGLLVALGPVAARVGMTSMIVMMVTVTGPAGRTRAGVAAMIFAVGVLQMLLAVSAWPLQRIGGALALATVLQQMRWSRDPPGPVAAPPVSTASTER